MGTCFGNVVFWGSSRATGTLKLRVNRHLGISVSPYTEIILKNVLGRLKNLPDTLKVALQAMICDDIVCGASACRAQKDVLSESKNPPYQSPEY